VDARHRAGLVLMLVAIVFWSTAEVFTRTIVDQITPLQLGCIRFVMGVGFLAPFVWWEMRRKQLRFDRRTVLHAAWLGGVGIMVSNLALQYSLKYAGASIVATMFGTSPLFTLLIAAVVLRDPITRPRLLGVIVGFVGIAILSMTKPSETFSMLGFSIALIMAFAMAVFLVGLKRLAGPYSGLPFTTLCMAFGTLYIIPMVLIEADTSTLVHMPAIAWTVLYLGFGTTGVAYYCYYTGLERVDATQAASTLFLKPPLATLLAVALLGEPLTWNLAIAMVLIFLGLYLVLFRAMAR
jgi:drug/metabolite transporter (DMT)-like permease